MKIEYKFEFAGKFVFNGHSAYSQSASKHNFCQARPILVFVPGWVWIRTRSLQGITTRCWRKTALDIRSSDGFLWPDQKRKSCKCTLRQITHWLKQQEPASCFTRLHNSFYLSGPESSLNTTASSCNFSHDSMAECARFCIKLFRLRLSRIDGVWLSRIDGVLTVSHW
jgi:hypothetical protein